MGEKKQLVQLSTKASAQVCFLESYELGVECALYVLPFITKQQDNMKLRD